VLIVAYRLTLGEDDKPMKNVHVDTVHQVELVDGPLLLKDGKLRMSGQSKQVTRHMDMDLVVPGILGSQVFNMIKFKRGMIHSFINKDHAIIIEMTDRQYLGQFGFYYYNFESKKLLRHKENLFPGQYNKIGDDFLYFKGEFSMETATFQLSIKDKDIGDSFEREFTFNVPAIGLEGKISVQKEKNQEGAFHTYPLFQDKRYWARTYCQMNMEVKGHVSTSEGTIMIDSSNEVTRWDANFNDWAGIFPHKTFLIQSWWHFAHGRKSNHRDIGYDRLSFYTNSGLQHHQSSRAETDFAFHNKTSHPMEPMLQWPNHDDYMDPWRMEAHSEMRYSDSKVVGFFKPEHMFENAWDIGLVREDEKLLFGQFDVSELFLKREYDDRFSKMKAYGFVWYNYWHW